MPEFITAATDEDFRQARTLLREYEDFVEVDLCFQGFEEELRDLERVYGPPGSGVRRLDWPPSRLVAGC